MALRYDRTGEPYEDYDAAPSLARPPELRPHDPRCRLGWLPDDDQGRPVPCPRCRPHLIRGRRQLHTQLHGPIPHTKDATTP